MAHEEFRPNDLQGALAHLIEECGEVLAAAGKIGRFGFDSVNPLIPVAERETNAAWLLREMADLEKAISALRFKMQAARMVPTAPQNLSKSLTRRMLGIGTRTLTCQGGGVEAFDFDVLVELGYARLDSAERHPYGRRCYCLTAEGLMYLGLLQEAA